MYIHFRVLLPPHTILPGAKFTLRPSFAFSCIGSVTARHSSNGRPPNFAARTRNGITELSQRAPPIFDRAAITLGIGQHSSSIYVPTYVITYGMLHGACVRYLKSTLLSKDSCNTCSKQKTSLLLISVFPENLRNLLTDCK